MPRPLQLDILVSLVGELRWGMEQALVTAYKISPVSCQAEFDAHLLEIAVLPLRLRKMQERAADIARAAFMGQDLTGVHNRNQLQTQSAQLLPNNVQHQVWINTILGFGVSLCQGQPFWRLEQQAGVSILRYIGISIPIKYSNFSGFYKKLGPFYKKLRCDKFGN